MNSLNTHSPSTVCSAKWLGAVHSAESTLPPQYAQPSGSARYTVLKSYTPKRGHMARTTAQQSLAAESRQIMWSGSVK